MFMGKDNADQLIEIAKVLGTEELYLYIKKYNITVDQKEHCNLKHMKKVGVEKYKNEENKHLCGEDAMDLLKKLLTYDHA